MILQEAIIIKPCPDHSKIKKKLFYFRLSWWRVLLLFLLLPQSLLSFNKTVIKQNQVSLIQLPVKYLYQELAKSLNRFYQEEKQGVLCKDDSYTNNNNDNFKVICHQLNDIKVTRDDNKVITEVNVRINAEFLIEYHVKINFWFFDYDYVFKLERSLKFDLYVKFITSVDIDEGLLTHVNTDWEYEWLSLPYISFGPISFRVLNQVTPKVEAVLKDFADNKIDKTVLKVVDINSILYKSWEHFKEPLELNSNYNVWNFFRLQKIYSGGVYIDSDKLIFPFQVSFKNYTGFGSNIISKNFELKKNVIPGEFEYSNLSFTNKNFYLRMPLKLTVADMEKLIFDDISKKDYVFGTGNLQLKITEIYLSIDKSFVNAEVYLSGVSERNLLGNVVLRLSFNPVYSITQKKLRARYLTYEIVRSDTALLDIINAIQKEEFTRLLQDTIVLEFDTYVDSIHQLLNENLSNYAFNEKLTFQATVDKIDIKNIFIQEKELYMILDLNGNVELYLQNLF